MGCANDRFRFGNRRWGWCPAVRRNGSHPLAGQRLQPHRALPLRLSHPRSAACRWLTCDSTGQEAAQAADARAAGRFEVGYLTVECAVRGAVLDDVWPAPFEHVLPVRRFVARKGQQHLSGLWWSATTGGAYGVRVVAGTSRDAAGLRPGGDRHRVPAVLAALARPDRHPSSARAGLFRPPRGRFGGGGRLPALRSGAARGMRPRSRPPGRRVPGWGWEYRLVGAADAIVTANVRRLAGYRHPRHHPAGAGGCAAAGVR